MNAGSEDPQLPDDWISAFLDGELPAGLSGLAEERLASSVDDQERLQSLRDLERVLESHLRKPLFDEAQFLNTLRARELSQQQLQLQPAGVSVTANLARVDAVSGGNLEFRKSVRSTPVMVTCLASMLVVWGLAMLLVTGDAERIPNGQAGSAEARLTAVTGDVAVCQNQGGSWAQVVHPGSLVKGSRRIRTGLDGLCEIGLPAGGVIRLKQSSEVVVEEDSRIVLERGTLWCRTGDVGELVIVRRRASPPPAVVAARLPGVVLCASADSSAVCSVYEEDLIVLSTGQQPVRLLSDGQPALQLPLGQSSRISDGSWLDDGSRDHLMETAWFLPLLAQRDVRDSELQSMLERLLAGIGQSKLSGLYDEQIRALGPRGTLPLLAYVRSSRAGDDPEQRRRAMRIVADLAPRSALPELQRLLQDADPVVADLARQTILRLRS